jgi:hypothetical protein
MPNIDEILLRYDDLDEAWTGILIGNGASRAISSKFAYQSLYEIACSENLGHALSEEEQAIFDLLNTRNFEQVLSILATGMFVNAHFKLSFEQIDSAYERIRLALVHAVRSVHILRADVADSTLDTIRDCLRRYDFVYSTNYDLLLYWSIMRDPAGFTDYFFSGAKFDPSNSDVWYNPTRIHYLHGALHLYVNQMRDTFKRLSGDSGNLLEAFGEPLMHDESAVPLFVSEGTSRDKLRSILNSTYLSYVYSLFARHSGSLLIFGQALDKQYDGHLIDAIRRSSNRTLGIAIYPSSGTNLIQVKAEWYQKFADFRLVFFDSRTHPLGSSDLAIT